MSDNRDDLNNFDLGLPDFGAPGTPPSSKQPSSGSDGLPGFETAPEEIVPEEVVSAEEVVVESVPVAGTPAIKANSGKAKAAATPPATTSPATPAHTESTLGKVAKGKNAATATTTASSAAKPTTAAAANAAVPANAEAATEQVVVPVRRMTGVWAAVPSWAISTVVHVAAILVLAAWNIEPITEEIKLMLVSSESLGETESLDEFSIDEAMSSELEATENEETTIDSPVVDAAISETEVTVEYNDVLVPNMPAVSMTSVTQNLTPKSALSASNSAAMRAALNGRSKETKRDLLKKFGGTSETERAVSMSLKWLAQHQDPETGAWTLAHSFICNGQCDHPGSRRNSPNAATGLALMCFLGAGQTHMEGEYKDTVLKGLGFLIRNIKVQKGMGSWWSGDGFKGFDDMYAHGIVTIVMCEAYGMTKDPQLLEAAQLGINYLGYAQNPSTGGWHYSPFPIGQTLGDTSVVGWQMMALKSAAMSGLEIDLDVVRRANVFLDQMEFDNGTSYHYDFNSKATNAGYNPGTTSCALLCRMYSGFPKTHPSIVATVKKFSAAGPSPNATYYNYYATQVMKQYGGTEWENWNIRMRDQLVASQVQKGHGAGSWYWDDGHSTESGGRLYTTCMATMMLEVYYRYMPLYGEQTEDDAFQL